MMMPSRVARLALLLCAVVVLSAVVGGAAPAVAPGRLGPPIALFNGKDLSGFTTWLAEHKHADPDNVFTVADVGGEPAIRISGQGYGGLITRDEYANFILEGEYRWGERTWAPRERNARDSGVLLRCQGPEGSASPRFVSPWMRSVEFQVIEGGTGDIILISGYDQSGAAQTVRMTCPVRPERDAAGQAIYDPAGTPTALSGGRIDWYGRDPAWRDDLGYRGKRDRESPHGKWTRFRILCDGGSFTYSVNGKVVNAGTDCNLTHGRILFQTEGAEVYYRRLKLTPLLPRRDSR
jgi:hypothetical protein